MSLESLKIHDKKPVEKPVEEPKVIEVPQAENTVEEVKTEGQKITQHIEEVKKNKPTFGQSILEKVKKPIFEISRVCNFNWFIDGKFKNS